MASSSNTGTISDEERRWVIIGVCLNKVIAPALKKVLQSELDKWYIVLCQPPDEINKQNFLKHKKRLPPSKFALNYISINNNEKKSHHRAYDFQVKDSLSLAKLFLKPNMAKFTGFNETMDMSAILGVMCNAKPFSSAATVAETVRNDIRNKWAHCNFSEWTASEFTASIQNLKSLINTINLAPADAKALCDGLDDWKKKSLQWCVEEPVNSELLKLVTEEVAELRKSVETCDTKISEVLDNFDKKLRDMLCRTEKLEELAAENSKGIKRNSEGVERNSEGVERNSQGVQHNSEELQRQSEKLELFDKKRRTEDHGFQQFSKNKVPYGLRSLPRDMVERPSEVNEILGLLIPGNSKVGVVGSRSGDVFGIRGMGGLGKTVLALAVAWAASDSRQVIWLDIGETPDCLALINILVKVLGGAVSFSDIHVAQAWIKANTSDKDCLVVLDDVWSVDDVAVFDHLCGKCQLLITTRDAKVVRGSKGFVYELQFMAADKSRALLYQSAGVVPDELSTFSPEMHQIVEELLKQCRGLPLALSLVGSNLIDTRLQQDWQDVLGYFQNAGLEQLHSQFPTVTYPYDNILAAIDASFQRLRKNEREKFLDFGIFPEDINVASDILELFWSSKEAGRTSCSPQEGRCILKALERKSLIQKGPELQGKTSYRVHDLLLEFARQKLQATGTLTDVQRVFVKILRGQCVNGEWTSTSQKDYYFKYLPYHLHSSKQHSELLQLLFDFHWLEQKVKHTNFPSLISDFRFLDTPLQHEIKLLKKSLMLSADAIEKNLSSIGPQLLGRLLSYASDECPSVKKLLDDVRETSRKTCRLLPLFSCLKLEGAEIFKKNVGSAVRSLATSTTSTGTIVISGLVNGSIHIHELETGEELQVLKGHKTAVSCLALSHSQRHLASGSRDKTSTVWDMSIMTTRIYKRASHNKDLKVEGGDVYALDFSTDDERLFTGSHDGNLRVWLVTTGEQLDVISAHDEVISSLCTTKDGLYIATASRDHTIKLWRADTDTLNFEATLVGHTDVVRCVVAAGNDNPMLVSASLDGTLKIWDAKKHKEIHTLRGHEDGIYSVAVSSDTNHIISGGEDMIMRLWCFHTGELLFCFEGHSRPISSLSITSEKFKAVSGSSDGSFRVWNLDTSAHLKQDRSRGHSKSVIDIAVTHDGSRCVTASFDGFFKVWMCKNEEECSTLKDPTGYPVNVAISDDRVVSLSLDSLSSSIKVWDFDGNEKTGIELDNKAELVRFSTDGSLVIIGCEDERVVIWDWQNYDKKREVTLPSPFTTFAEIACEGNIIYTCSRNMKVCQIDVGSLEVSAVRQGPYPNCTPVVVLPDGKTALLGSLDYSGLAHWKPSSNHVFVYETGHSDDSIVTAIDITSNGKLALNGSSSGTLSLVNLGSRQVVETFTTTKAGVGVRLVCILSDEARFVFVDQANRVELRDFSNKEAELLLDQPAVKVTCITTLGVDYVLLGCENGELLLFNLHVKQYEYEHQAHSEAVSQVKSNADSLLHFVSGSASGCVKLWHVSKTRESGSTSQNINSLFCCLGGAKFMPLWSQVWSHDNVYPHPITALTFVLDSKDIMIGSFYGNKVHRINAAGIVHTYEFDGHRIAALRVVEDSLIAVGLSHHVFKVIKWSLNEGLVIDKFSRSRGKQHYEILRVNNASNHVASIDCNSLLIWNLKCGTMLHRLDIIHDISALALVPGEFLLSGSDRHKTLTLWDLRNGRFVEEFHFDRGVRAIACSSNGMVCVGLNNGQVCFLRFDQ